MAGAIAFGAKTLLRLEWRIAMKPLRILIACDSFKGSLDSARASQCISAGMRRVFPDAVIESIPMADGGEGTTLALTEALGGRLRRIRVTGPMGAPVEAVYGLLPGGEAVMDMASASGLTLVPEGKADVLSATTYGTGQLILAALDAGCRRIYLGIGGSATNDGGLGMAQALGARFSDGDGRILGAADTAPRTVAGTAQAQDVTGAVPGTAQVQGATGTVPGATGATSGAIPGADAMPGAGDAHAAAAPPGSSGTAHAFLAGKHLADIASIDLSQMDPRLAETEISVLCDVTNPLCGPDGAAYVYGPQKGAGPAEIALLDEGLAHLAAIVRRDTGRDLADRPGAGAAGGLGFGLMAFAGATLKRGVDFLLDASGFDAKAREADLIITGEGKLDSQSAYGKVPAGVARRGAAAGVPVLAIGGAIDGDLSALYRAGVSAAQACVCNPMTLSEAMEGADALLEDAAERLMRTVQAGMHMHIPITKSS